MSKRTFFAAAIIAASQGLPAAAQEPSADTVVATVNGTDITLGHMIVLRDGLPDQYQTLPADVLFEGIVEQLVQQTVLAQSFEGLDRAIGLRLQNEERSLRAGAAINQAVDARVTDEALEGLYQSRFAEAAPEAEFNASHILVETEEQAQALVTELAEGAEFAALAREHSIGPSGPNGGQLGWFGLGMMVQPFEEAVVALSAGDVSQPVQTQFGWHVIALNETRMKDAPPLDAVRAELLEELRQLAIEEVIGELMGKAEVARPDLSAIDPSVIADTSLVDQ